MSKWFRISLASALVVFALAARAQEELSEEISPDAVEMTLETAIETAAQTTQAVHTADTSPLPSDTQPPQEDLQKAQAELREAVQKLQETVDQANETNRKNAEALAGAIQDAAQEFEQRKQEAEKAQAAAENARAAAEEAQAAAEDAEQRVAEREARARARKCIAMLPFQFFANTYSVGDQEMYAKTIADNLLSDFNQYFLQSPRFRVLSRLDGQTIGQENQLILNTSPEEEYYKLARTYGLDYLLTGSVKQFYIAPPQVVTIQLTGAQYVTIPSATMELDYRIVDVATTEIVWADHIILDLTPQEITAAGNDIVTLYFTLCQLASRRIAEAMDAIAPIRVLQIQPNGDFVLDRAGTLVLPGSLYDIFRRGELILDPETGEELGRPEYQLATVEIQRVDTKLSYAKICSGSGVITTPDLESGLVARPHRYAPNEIQQPTKEPRPQIRLPMD